MYVCTSFIAISRFIFHRRSIVIFYLSRIAVFLYAAKVLPFQEFGSEYILLVHLEFFLIKKVSEI